jgi:trk system potassium uptake protein TrkH
VSALDLIFEQISAFGTVGLSTGLTPELSTAGKLWICATMFVGRTGPLTVALWMFSRDIVRISYPKGKVMIG